MELGLFFFKVIKIMILKLETVSDMTHADRESARIELSLILEMRKWECGIRKREYGMWDDFLTN